MWPSQSEPGLPSRCKSQQGKRGLRAGARRAQFLGWTWVFRRALQQTQEEVYEVLEGEGEVLVGLAVRLHEEGEGLVGRGDWMGPSHKQWRGWEGQGGEGEKGAPSQGRVNSQV